MTLDELAHLQAAFGAQMMARPPALTSLAPWLDDDACTARRLSRYGAALRHHHERSLKLVFPVLNALVGDGFFRTLARAYGDAHPSQEGNLARFGAALPAFIAGFPAAADHPYFSDVARLEWLLHNAHGAADAQPLSLHEVRAADPAEVVTWRLGLHPSAVPYASAWRTAEIWCAHTQPLTHPLPDSIDWPTYAVVHRNGWTATVRETGAAEWSALVSLADTATLGDALVIAQAERARAGPHAPPFEPATLFAGWLTNGLLVRA